MLDELTGSVCGKLTVVGRVIGRPKLLVRCECGVEVEVRPETFRNGKARACGCSNVAHSGKGNSRHPLYRTWSGMLHRCYNKATLAYANYGARGITVCDRWHDITNFAADMGPKPAGMSIDRIDNDGPYSPENCRWATQKEQANNCRRRHYTASSGESHTIRGWAERLGVKESTVRCRLDRGWTIDEVANFGTLRPWSNKRTLAKRHQQVRQV